jgi:DNA-binding FadR family transcriptional regulator
MPAGQRVGRSAGSLEAIDPMSIKSVSVNARRGAPVPANGSRVGAASGARLYKRVADELRSAILAGRYLPGRRLPAERELGEMFNVSRPTVREALFALELQGLVEVRVGTGVFALDPGKVIESESAALAARLIDDEQLARLERLIDRMQVPEMT